MNEYAECQKCNARFVLNNNIVKYQKEFKVEDGQSIYLTYYDCPSCGRRHWVQIDDSESIRMLREHRKQFIRLSKQKKSGKIISKKQSAKFAKNQEDLSNYRIELMKKITGKRIVNVETGIHYTLEFSV